MARRRTRFGSILIGITTLCLIGHFKSQPDAPPTPVPAASILAVAATPDPVEIAAQRKQEAEDKAFWAAKAKREERDAADFSRVSAQKVQVNRAYDEPAQVPAPTVSYTGSGRTGAKCADGSYSSATGSGACSHHGGVAQWVTDGGSSEQSAYAKADADLYQMEQQLKVEREANRSRDVFSLRNQAIGASGSAHLGASAAELSGGRTPHPRH